MSDCIFCDIIHGEAPASEYKEWGGAVISFAPLNPVTEGHLLFVPVVHAQDAAEDTFGASLAFEHAAWYGRNRGHFNIVTSAGVYASQSIFHTHIHFVPRRNNDGLLLPWSNQIKE
jgi:histidine triad (HIT) family protein